jgi:hypothetical protein
MRCAVLCGRLEEVLVFLQVNPSPPQRILDLRFHHRRCGLDEPDGGRVLVDNAQPVSPRVKLGSLTRPGLVTLSVTPIELQKQLPHGFFCA